MKQKVSLSAKLTVLTMITCTFIIVVLWFSSNPPFTGFSVHENPSVLFNIYMVYVTIFFTVAGVAIGIVSYMLTVYQNKTLEAQISNSLERIADVLQEDDNSQKFIDLLLKENGNIHKELLSAIDTIVRSRATASGPIYEAPNSYSETQEEEQ